MNPGDMVVCGVAADIVVEDIGLNVPKGVAVPVSGEVSQRSRDLWRYLSQGLIFRCDVSNIVRSQASIPVTPQFAPEGKQDELQVMVSKLQADVSQARSAQASLEANVGRLQAENARLRTELVEERLKLAKLDKLDEILSLLQRQQTRPILVSTSQDLDTADALDDVPRYIPSQIKPDLSIDSPVTATEAQSDGDSVVGAAKALRQVRRRVQ